MNIEVHITFYGWVQSVAKLTRYGFGNLEFLPHNKALRTGSTEVCK